MEIELTNQILTTAKEIADQLPATFKKYALRKIEAAQKAGTLKAAKTAAEDIVLMAEKSAEG